ncbi:MAG: 2-oxo acid dehydrogenase subunit E2 [Phycisphaeraceae bacterium]|nr:2-oxo acid dehydrogenase subunit E2 [Phycisphaeraceae bacterium]
MAIEVKMPRLSDTMEMGTVVRWAVKPGQKVRSGDVIADIETDKATMELQTFDDGTVASVMVDEGQQVPVGTTIMKLAESGESVDDAAKTSGESAASSTKSEQANAGTSPRAASESASSGKTSGPGSTTAAKLSAASAGPSDHGLHGGNGHSSTNDRVFASPLARKIAAERGVDLSALSGSGPGGRIVQKDVEAAAVGGGASRAHARHAGTSMPMAYSGGELTTRNCPLSNMRATIAKRLVQSKTTVPHYQVTVTVRMDALLDLRKQLNDQLAAQKIKLSVNDFIVRACALAMHEHPYINARWTESNGKPSLDFIGEVNIGVAVALPVNEAGEGGGLVVATLRNADRMGLRQISDQTKRLSDKARTKGLSVEEMADSTFTISNLGMFGVEHFTAIINPPNAAILAVGAAVEKPVVNTDPETGVKELTIGHEMQMTMSSDHRVIDGAMAAQYLASVKRMLEAPATLLV